MSNNKFNIAWQIVRVEARKIKDPQDKIDHVMGFLKAAPNIHNKDRVKNWLKMTSVAYPDAATRSLFQTELDYIQENPQVFSSSEDNKETIDKVSNSDLMSVYDDLKKRKYGLQFKSVPKAHVEFMEQLEEEISRRNL